MQPDRSSPNPAPGFPTVGVVGGGQLARMLAQAAVPLGVRLRVLARSADESAAQVSPDVVVGEHDDLDALRRFSAGCDVVTFDHEHVPPEHLRALVAEGVVVRPGPDALVHAQDKVLMRRRLTEAGLPCPRWAVVADAAEAVAFADRLGVPPEGSIVVKTPRGGYDGHGVWVLDRPALAGGLPAPGPLLAEEHVAFTRELAVLVARSPSGQAVSYPVVQTVQTDGICSEVVAPAPGLSEDDALEAQRIGLAIAEELGVLGLLAVELFQAPAGLLVNELAMRPHNSGHWSIDGSRTGQFEQHLRAVLDLPLGDPSARDPHTVMVNVLGGPADDLYWGFLHCLARDPGLKVHVYGKPVRPGRKLGHVTVGGDALDDLLGRARHAAAFLVGFDDGEDDGE